MTFDAHKRQLTPMSLIMGLGYTTTILVIVGLIATL